MFPSIRRTPSSKGTRGSQPKTRRISAVSAKVQSGSPGRLGMCTTGPPSSSTRRATLWGLPEPTLKTFPLTEERAAQSRASATSAT